MAFSSTIFILLSLATASTIAHSLTLPVSQVIIFGRLVCTASGNPVSGILDEPLAGVNATVSCNGGETILGQALTNATGLYEVILSTADALLFDESVCFIYIKLPAVNCTLLPPTGTLQAPANLLTIVSGLLGLVEIFVAGVYVIMPTA